MRLGITAKLVLLTVALVGACSIGFTAIYLRLTRGEVEADLRQRAVIFAHEIAATINDRQELESGVALGRQIRSIMEARPSVLQMEVLVFEERGASVVATSNARTRLPFSRQDGREVHAGRTVSRLVGGSEERYWEVLAPIRLDGLPVGAIGVKFSTAAADRLAARIRTWALAVAVASLAGTVVVTAAVAQWVVARPIRRFLAAIDGIPRGVVPRVDMTGSDEFAVLARHFNDMLAQITRFNEDLQLRVSDATRQLDRRLQEVSRLNEQLFQAQRRLRHAERLALAGRFMAQIAHEIGTPLHSVAGHLELLRRELPAAALDGEPGRRLRIVEDQLVRVSQTIARLLGVTRSAPGSRERVAVNALVAETVELIRPGVTAGGLTLELDASPDDPAVDGRAPQLQQVLLNLLTNAIDATPSPGRIAVRTRRPAPGRVEIEVADSGRGISPEVQDSLFDPFFTTKEAGRGTGLGLFIAAEIVREHGGEISVKSQAGEGSSFLVGLPAAEATS